MKSFEICIQKCQQKGFENEELAGVKFQHGLVLKRQSEFLGSQKNFLALIFSVNKPLYKIHSRYLN
jgi:hypothetical protein